MTDNGKDKKSVNPDWEEASSWFNERQNRINTSGGRFSPESRAEAQHVTEEKAQINVKEDDSAREKRTPKIKKIGKKKPADNKNDDSSKSKDELRREYADKTRKRRKRRIIEWFVFTALIFVAIFVVTSLTVLFHIENINVEGDTRYSVGEITDSSGIKKGDNLWRTSKSDVESLVTQKLPYIGKVSLSRKIPSTITVIVEETSASYALKSGKKYVLVDSGDKILETKAKKPGKAVVIDGVTLTDSKAGMKIQPENTEMWQTAKDILESGNENKLKLTEIHVSDGNDLSAVCEGKIRLDLGSATQLAEKMKMANEVIERLKSEGALSEGVINLKSTTKAFYKDRPLTEPETTTEKPTEPVTDENPGTEQTATGETATGEGTTGNTQSTSSQSTTAAPSEDTTKSAVQTGEDIPEPPVTRPQG